MYINAISLSLSIDLSLSLSLCVYIYIYIYVPLTSCCCSGPVPELPEAEVPQQGREGPVVGLPLLQPGMLY